jgi:steroid delta-isomerase-like uncharacterized protein
MPTHDNKRETKQEGRQDQRQEGRQDVRQEGRQDQRQDNQQEQRERNKQIVHRFMDEGWSQGKTNVATELLANNCRFHDEVFPHLTSGAENLRRHIESCRAGFPDLKFTIDDTIAERDEVVAHWTAQGTHKGQFLGMPATNKKASVSGTSIYRLENGKIVESWANWNLMSMMEQLGVGSAPQEQTSKQNAGAKAQDTGSRTHA